MVSGAGAVGRENGPAGTAAIVWRGLRDEPWPYLKRLALAVHAGFVENNLLTYANAIAFRIFFAIIPFALFLLGLAGALGLEQVWDDEVAPKLETGVSP